ncbi:hypothetical protein HK097_002027 [Rhizophlyctis rosea]|uniref:NmrA-like domain-containing protein n=1 Tax=Rhizophlyctis rosea TaxID=64517 RepID=A0AAD5S3Y0_9FUNG|nr:hypothetical protein HK097_002027 [Rhizophlyctis rosea]
MSSNPTTKILLLGAGELGTAFLPHLSSLPNTQITIAVRTPPKYTHLLSTHPNVHLLPLNTSSPSPSLSLTFSHYDIIISCTGFGQDVSVFPKLANEVLEAGKVKKKRGEGKLWFFPWQWGVDYDVTGDGEGLMPLFGKQVEVRNILRTHAKESHVKWTVLSTGIFMSFLFEPFWGVVERRPDSGDVTVRALGSWEHKVTVTYVNDIGRVLASVVNGEVDGEDRVLYAGGDTVSYAQLADIVEGVVGKKVRREEWSIPHLKRELEEDPEDGIKKYRLVFARDGVWWDVERTVNHKLQIPMMDVQTYVEKTFVL